MQSKKNSKAKSKPTKPRVLEKSAKDMERFFQENHELFTKIVSAIPDAVILSDLQGKIIFVNDVGVKLAGYASTKEIVGKDALSLVAPQERKKAEENLAGLLKGSISPNEYTLVAKDGKHIPIEIHGSVLRNTDDSIFARIHVCRDITERKQSEEFLRESNERFSALFERSLECVYIHDLEGNFIDCNQAALDLVGYSLEEIRNLDFSSLIVSEQLHVARKTMKDMMRGTNRSGITEFRVKHKDGSYRDVETSGTAIYREGKPHAILGVARDVTERRRIEIERQQNIERLQKSLGKTIQAIAAAIETRDPFTAGHQRRVAELARNIAAEMGLTTDQIDGILMASIIHDLGKISVPADILSKPAKLTNIEYALVKTHPKSGYDILKDIDFPWPVARIILEHHERMDGSGYPHGLKGEAIILEARIIAVADVVEAMVSHRPDRPSLGIAAALAEIERNKGTLYDTVVVEACLRLFREKDFQLKKHDFEP
jgi:PAS domain S-box-containing protein